MSHPETGERKRLSMITSSSLQFRDDWLKGKERLPENRKARSGQERSKQDRFLRSHRLCASLAWEKRQQEMLLSTLSRAGEEREDGGCART
jgi:hypothetical protein